MRVQRVMFWAVGAVLVAAWFAWGPSLHEVAVPQNEPARAALAAAPAVQGPQADTGDGGSGPAAPGEVAGRSCTVQSRYLPNGDGTVTEVFACEPEVPAQPQPYESYPSDALQALAYSDPEAAAILSLRWRRSDTAAAMRMAVRASALAGGDAGPVVAFSNAYPAPTAIDDEPVPATVRVKYVLGAVTRRLGDSRHGTPYFEAIIREHSPDPDREIALLEERALELIEEMRQVQLDVTGSSTIGG